MSISNPSGKRSIAPDQADDVSPVVEELIEVVSEQAEQIDDLTDTVERQQNEIQELREQQSTAAKDRAETKKRLTEVEDDLEDVDPDSCDRETAVHGDERTPIEQLSTSDDVSDVTDSVSVERAVTLFRNLSEWGKRTPKGVVLRPADSPLKLLEAARDESLAWNQFYRSARVLEKLSKGAVTFFDSDRHGKMICLHEQSEVYERVTNGSLTASSARRSA